MIKIKRVNEPVLTKVMDLVPGDCFIVAGSSHIMMIIKKRNYSQFNAIILDDAEPAIIDPYVCVTKVLCEITVKIESQEG